MNIAYITSSKIPSVYDAQAQRCLSIIKLFDNSMVDIVSNCKNIAYGSQCIGNNIVRFHSYRRQKDVSKIDKVITHLRMKDELAYVLKAKKFDLIIFNDLSFGMMKVIRRYQNEAKLLYDAVEWYSPSENLFGKLSLNYLNNNYVNKYFVTSKVAVISISRFFDDYFTKKNIKSFYMPVILDKETYLESAKQDECINIIYAGYMGKKDHIKQFVKQFSLCDDEVKKKVKITLVGPNKSQFSDITNFESIEFMNFMPHDKLLQLYQRMDFSILFRDETQRYAKAGFPTKLAESMMCGVPAICNLFSNIGDYLIDGQNAIVVSNKVNFDSTFRKIMSLDVTDVLQMKKKARETAESAFDYNNYKTDYLSFIGSLGRME